MCCRRGLKSKKKKKRTWSLHPRSSPGLSEGSSSCSSWALDLFPRILVVKHGSGVCPALSLFGPNPAVGEKAFRGGRDFVCCSKTRVRGSAGTRWAPSRRLINCILQVLAHPSGGFAEGAWEVAHCFHQRILFASGISTGSKPLGMAGYGLYQARCTSSAAGLKLAPRTALLFSRHLV